jgi:hypothetical protein
VHFTVLFLVFFISLVVLDLIIRSDDAPEKRALDPAPKAPPASPAETSTSDVLQLAKALEQSGRGASPQSAGDVEAPAAPGDCK